MKLPRPRVRISSLLRDERAASAVEYGLILSLVFLALMGGVASLGGSVKGRWDSIANRVSTI